ncbi:MAG: GrpB family protein [Pseudomonadales bacterium]
MNYIREYQISWVDDFKEIARFLESCLPDGVRIHHVGSTSVQGMPAKDIIDVDIECPRGSMVRIIARLAEAGYEHEGDLGVTTREAFRPCDQTAASHLRPHHLYACETESPELGRHLAFRDYLLSHPERASWLANEKRRADNEATSRDAYIDGKAASYKKIVSEALSWVAGR